MSTGRSETLTGTVEVPFPEYLAPPAEPIGLLHAWLEQAKELGIREPGALALATADEHGRTSVRTVALIRLTERGLVFATHDISRKGRDLKARPFASGLLYWRETSRQVSVDGSVRWLSEEENDALWARRPVFTHAMTVSSLQSEPLEDVEELRGRAKAVAGAGPQGRPVRYVGIELVVESVEFWANGSDRLHERLRYEKADGGEWTASRLQP